MTARVYARIKRWFGTPVSKHEKFRQKLLGGTSRANIGFEELCNFLKSSGFQFRIKGSHHIFWRDEVRDIINLQPAKDGKAKAFQVNQVRNVISRLTSNE